jgi:flagellar basal body-associated protein FliL
LTVHISGNGWIIFLKIVAVFAVLFVVIVIMAAVYMMGWALANSLKMQGTEQARRASEDNPAGPDSNPTIDAAAATPAGVRERIKILWEAVQNMRIFVASALSWKIPFLSLYAFPIAFVEKTIKINNIDLNSSPITSISQLLPLLVAAFSAVAIIWVSFWKVFPDVWKQAVEQRARANPSPEHPGQVYPPWASPFITAHQVGDWLHQDFSSSPLPALQHPYQRYHAWSQRSTAPGQLDSQTNLTTDV